MKKTVLALMLAFVFCAVGMSAATVCAEEQGPGCVLASGVQYTGMVPLRNDSSWNGGYYYSDMTEDGITVIVNCCAANGTYPDAMDSRYRRVFAEMVSESEAMDYQDSQNQSLTEKFTYPVYDLSFTTGANEDTCLWKMIFFQTDTHTYAYAFKMDADFAEDMEGEYWYAVDSLEMIDLSYDEIGNVEYDPSANGESLEDFIAYFDTWYLYGDLQEESIRINGDGTWAYYNAIQEDGTGGYLFDDGTFATSGTTALQLYSANGSHVADVSLNEYGDLAFTPVIPGYAGFNELTIFVRESESVSITGYVEYDPSANGESLEDFIAYFDTWYLYGDLQEESIRLYGDGTWAYYNAIQEDGTGGYLFDDGTFVTSGTTALQLYSADGSHVADVSLNEYGDLALTPVIPGYAGFNELTIFVRESESVSITGYVEYDPSANGESLEDFIAFFDGWYLCGDLNGESIYLYGDGTWVFYNAMNEDGTGRYLFDEGTFVTFGTTALQLYSADGSYVADVSLNEYDELVLTPAIPGYADFYGDMFFTREAESVAYEAQTAGF